MRRVSIVLLGSLFACGLGCATTGFPHPFAREPAQYQQQRAQRYDPYAEAEYGPMDSVYRPRGYDKPIPEASRGRWNDWGAPRYGFTGVGGN